MAAEPKRRRRTRRESQALMLQAGAELALESLDADGETVDPLAFIRIADVAERATEIVRRTDPDAGAVTTGSIYPIWGDQAAFQSDLLAHLLEADHLGVAPEWNQLASYLERTDDDVRAAVARVVGIGWEHAHRNERLLLVLAHATQRHSPELHQLLVAHYERVWQQLIPTMQLICGRFGYRARPDATFGGFVRVVVGMIDGLTVQAHLEPDTFAELDQDLGGDRVTLVGAAAAALFDAWFEPIVPA